MAPRKGKEKWGHWYLNKSTAVLQLWLSHPSQNWDCMMYEVDLERCRNSAQVLDWILHIQGRFCQDYPGCISDFVRALNSILNLPSNYCSYGRRLAGLTNSEIKKRCRTFSKTELRRN